MKFEEFQDMAMYANKMLREKKELEDYLEKYKTIVSTSSDFLALIDKNYVYHAANETYLRYFESKEGMVGKSAREIFGEITFETIVKPLQDRALRGEAFMIESWVDFPSARRYLQIQYTPYKHDEKKEVEFFVVAARDITDKKLADEQLKLWGKVFETTSEAVMVCDSSMNVVAVNCAFTKITGYTKEDAVGQKSTFVSFDAQTNPEFLHVINYIQKHGYWSGEVRYRRKNGDIYPALMSADAVLDEEGNHINYVSIFYDITSLKESERKLEFMAHHDTLTNLPNRILLNDRISHALENAKRENSMVAVCFIDLDNFKKINDSFGHAYGDDVLKQTTKRIKSLLRATDTLSRIGGDEFVLLFEHLKDISEIEKIITKVQQSFVEPFISKNQKFFITGSIGISLYPQHGNDAEELIKNADIAMYKAKDAGKNTYRFYTEDMSVESYAIVDIENALKDAISEGQFLVYYQPQVNLKTKEVIGVEALLRWDNPQKGILPPSQFIKISEDTKMIIPIGEFVLHQACSDIVAIKKEGIFDGKVSINVSGIQIEHSDFLAKLSETIDKTGINPSHIELEITESVVMKDAQKWIELLHEMKKTGIKIAIDDFGTGYSSLSYLRRLPIDKLKIDMSFVRDLPDAEDACMIANSIINLSDNMKMITLAEGIETIEQEAYLRDNNCEEGQGYLYAKPMNLEALKIWLKSR
jgi:diguanylate cyclase (GGDEF)-like protein/PAS domain S-box-containing protein